MSEMQPHQGDEALSRSKQKVHRSSPLRAWSPVILAMIVAGPSGVFSPAKGPRVELFELRPETIQKSLGERDIVNEEPADGSPPVHLESFGIDDGEAQVTPAAIEAEKDPGTEAPLADPTAPRYLGVVSQDGVEKAIFMVPGEETPWLGKPGERIGNSRFRLESLEGATSPLERTPDG